MGKQPEKCPGNRQKPAKQDKEINDQHPLYSPIPRVSKETTTRKTKTKNKNKTARYVVFFLQVYVHAWFDDTGVTKTTPTLMQHANSYSPP